MGMAVPFSLFAGGEGDFEFAGGKYGVAEEELVEVAEAEHQEGTWDLLLQGVVLPHQGRSCHVGVHGETSIVHNGAVRVGFVFSSGVFFPGLCSLLFLSVLLK
jgi:hypothetical protein